MKATNRLTVLFIIIICLAGFIRAYGNERLKIADVASRPDSFAGRTVEVEARVVAINADGNSLELFDSPSHTRISVQLAELPRSERMALIRSDVREVMVRGRISLVDGRLTIHAASVQWNDNEVSK